MQIECHLDHKISSEISSFPITPTSADYETCVYPFKNFQTGLPIHPVFIVLNAAEKLLHHCPELDLSNLSTRSNNLTEFFKTIGRDEEATKLAQAAGETLEIYQLLTKGPARPEGEEAVLPGSALEVDESPFLEGSSSSFPFPPSSSISSHRSQHRQVLSASPSPGRPASAPENVSQGRTSRSSTRLKNLGTASAGQMDPPVNPASASDSKRQRVAGKSRKRVYSSEEVAPAAALQRLADLPTDELVKLLVAYEENGKKVAEAFRIRGG